MSAFSPVTSRGRRRIVRLILWGSGFTALFLLTGNGNLLLPYADFVFTLGVGWILFLARVGPTVTPNLAGLATGLFCTVFAVGIFHVLARHMRMADRLGSATESEWAARWPWVGTLAVVGALVLTFAAGLSAAGMLRHSVWLAFSEESWFKGMPAAKAAAIRIQTANNLKQIGLACQAYERERANLPPGGTFDAAGRGMHGWLTFLLPHLGRQDLYSRIDFARPWDDPVNATAFGTPVPGFYAQRQPSANDQGYGLAYYALNVHLARTGRPLNQRRFTDGAANTILAGELVERVPEWGQPANWRDPELGINQSPAGFGGVTRGVATFLMADGSVRTISDAVDPAVLRALSTPDVGDKLDGNRSTN